VCSNAWSGFLHESLRHLVEPGRGEPMQRLDIAEAS